MGAVYTFASLASPCHVDLPPFNISRAQALSAELHPEMMKPSQHTRVGAFVFRIGGMTYSLKPVEEAR